MRSYSTIGTGVFYHYLQYVSITMLANDTFPYPDIKVARRP